MTSVLQFANRYSAPLVLGGLLAAFTSPAVALSTKDRLQALEQRADRLDRVVENNDSEIDLLRQINELQRENQALRNAVETLQFETAQAADRQRQLYLDLDQRMQSLEASPQQQPAEGAAPAGGGVSDQQDYQAAFELLKAGRYKESSAAFTKFLSDFPGSDLRDNAQYWLAETYYVTQDFKAALSGFQLVISAYPASRKIPDAWLKVGYCNYEIKDWSAAREALTIAQSRFPETTAAKLAAQRLELMRTQGH